MTMDARPDAEADTRSGASEGPGRNARRDWTRTTCPYCGVGCGLKVRPAPDGLSAEVVGDETHPANFGRLCSKGAALGETLSHADRISFPEIGGRRVEWTDALDAVAGAFRAAIATHGPDSVAMYVSGQILTEDYYVANKLMKGFIGTANIDTNSRLCMASSVAGHKRAFGSDTVPGTYEDLELADLVILVGSNLAWCHPVLYQRLVAARAARGTWVIVIDPRATATCEIADQHLALKPGSDVALFNGLLADLVARGVCDRAYIDAYTTGFDAAVEAARALTIEEIAQTTGLPLEAIRAFYSAFAENPRVLTVYSQGVNQSSAGTDKVNAILNCHLATGRIGEPGCGPFSVTGQPNAMGGREVGGLATMLAAHMDLDNPTHRARVQAFWGSPRIADRVGLKAVDLFEAVHAGKIKALWIMSTNPVDSLPDADRVREALVACPFVVVSDVTRRSDTVAVADVVLPAAAWGEKDGTVTNSERRISRQRRFLNPPGEAQADWWQICEVAARLGYAEPFDYAGPADIYREYAALTGYENGGDRDLDLSAHADMTRTQYETLAPVQWPVPSEGGATETRFFADGGFYTPDRRARFIATPYRPPASSTSSEFPLVLNTGRIRDQWHTMTRTATTARLTNHISEPFVELHPDDAMVAGLGEADLVEVRGRHGRILARAVTTDRVARGSVFVPMHWTAQFASAGRVDTLVLANTDPVSGQPELKFTPVAVQRFPVAWFAFAVTPTRPEPGDYDYAAIAPAGDGTWRAELAGREIPEDWTDFATQLLGAAASEPPGRMPEPLAYHDVASGQYRFAWIEEGRCVGLLFVARESVAVSRTWAIAHVGTPLAPADRLRLLAGRPGADMPDRGRIVCACMDVGQNDVRAAVADGCATVDAVGARTGAGTNCGSCRSEIGNLIHDRALAEAV